MALYFADFEQKKMDVLSMEPNFLTREKIDKKIDEMFGSKIGQDHFLTEITKLNNNIQQQLLKALLIRDCYISKGMGDGIFEEEGGYLMESRRKLLSVILNSSALISLCKEKIQEIDEITHGQNI